MKFFWRHPVYCTVATKLSGLFLLSADNVSATIARLTKGYQLLDDALTEFEEVSLLLVLFLLCYRSMD